VAGVFPVADHYYEPLINFNLLIQPLEKVRNLPGIDMNVAGQLELLKQFQFSEELRPFDAPKKDDLTYSFGNGFFDSGDAEFLYNLVRLKKPHRVVEIGSGNSTLLVIEAVRRNRLEDPNYTCEHICIEPYEMPWLERSGVKVRRERVESVSRSVFEHLDRNDLLFIDSSHVIRPQGDVLCEFLEVLPILKSGVIIHIHDIFTPRDYPRAWVVDKVRLWNEQYLLEAILTENHNCRIIGAVNYLKCDHYDSLKTACPFLTPDREPGSFYIERV
jgi:predicted O-methyltransferase YrrM